MTFIHIVKELEPMKVAEIRKTFLNYFSQNGHTVVESSPLVPQHDPSLLFTNAGMNQFKDVFLGKEKRTYTRAASCQKCLRAGGKHNDLENVGFTARHHTFFEMLGNFSFGDYFKTDAISMAWDFVINYLKLPQDQLYVTVFEKDDEAYSIWADKIGVDAKHIYRLGEKDNFWSMGETGPCGPCSEIFIDRGEAYRCDAPVCELGVCDCDRFMEFWNLVFMQYDRNESGNLTPLPRPAVDTGMGLERIAAILQKVDTNYEIDSFRDILDFAAKLAGKSYVPAHQDSFAFRVIGDHARATAFLIADGVMPSNEGRGYVLRRIIRRAVRYGRGLGFSEAFLYKVCGYVIDQMQSVYPDLKDKKSFVSKAVEAEEEQFFRTLERGLSLLDDELAKLKSQKNNELPGEIAFRLYDTFGFPLDLTTIICRENQINIDEAGFQEAMAQQRQQSRQNWKGSGEDTISNIYHQLVSEGKSSRFVGYEKTKTEGVCLAIIASEQSGQVKRCVETINSDHEEPVELVFDRSVFYPEGGGQVGDQGTLTGTGPLFTADVLDTSRPLDNLIVMKVILKSGVITVGDKVHQSVDEFKRALTARNHTATHMLHWALRDTLGDHVKQAGSLVNSQMLRFDFSHFHAMTEDEIQIVEDKINQRIWSSSAVHHQQMSKEQAMASGAIAFFGEKYGESVRVVTVGDYSVELCGGTHISDSAEINLFKIISESSIASGVRRIIAYTSQAAFEYLSQKEKDMKLLQLKFKTSSIEELTSKIERLAQSEKDLTREIDAMRESALSGTIDDLVRGAHSIGDVKFICYDVPENKKGVKSLRDTADKIKQRIPNAIVVLTMKSQQAGKALLLVAKGKSVSEKVKAGDIVGALAPKIEGRGGGKSDMAQAGGSRLEGVDEIQKSALTIVSALLN